MTARDGVCGCSSRKNSKARSPSGRCCWNSAASAIAWERSARRSGSQGLIVGGPRGRGVKNQLLDIELKLSKQFSALWQTLGLSDREEAPARPVGRPPASEGKKWPE